MSKEQDLKLTDLDYLIGNHHIQMMKAALPYMQVSEQKTLSLFVKMEELQRTIHLFEDEEVASMGICSLDKQPTSPVDMLQAIKPYGNTKEQDMIELVVNMMQGFKASKSPFEQMKSILSPEQQSTMETYQMLMQAMQQFT